MIVDFPEPSTATAITKRWDAAAIAAHSPEFARHYRLSPSGSPKARAELWCELIVTGQDEDSATVKGRAGFAPTLPCGRCLKEGPLTIDVEVAVTVQHEPSATGADGEDQELDSRLLDVYLRRERTVDLFQIAIDAVELAVPEPVSFRDETGHCRLCGDSGHEPLVATGGKPEAANPFHALKSLKDKLKN